MNEEDTPVEVVAQTGEQSEDEIDVDLRQTPEYRRARGSIFMVALLFYGLLALMCIVVAVIVVILLTSS